jgi:CRP-like cAMP-binding protein
MANLDFVERNDQSIFGTVDTAVEFKELFAEDASLQRALKALQRGPVRFYRDNHVVAEDDLKKYLLFVVSGVARSCKVCKSGTRSVVAFYLPGDLFGWTDTKHSLAIEAASDTEVLFLKRGSLLSLATRDSRVASFLLDATTNELARTQGHLLLMNKLAKCRVATFLTELWVRYHNLTRVAYRSYCARATVAIKTYLRNKNPKRQPKIKQLLLPARAT